MSFALKLYHTDFSVIISLLIGNLPHGLILRHSNLPSYQPARIFVLCRPHMILFIEWISRRLCLSRTPPPQTWTPVEIRYSSATRIWYKWLCCRSPWSRLVAATLVYWRCSYTHSRSKLNYRYLQWPGSFFELSRHKSHLVYGRFVACVL